jgi:hypothetical protein
MTVDTGPCEAWPVVWCCPTGSYAASGVASAVMAATEALWALSGRRYGECEVTARPCSTIWLETWYPDWGTGWRPFFDGAEWFNVCGHGSSCSCTTVEEVILAPAPVSEVTEVMLDGSVLDPSAYRLDDHRRLVRTDGGRWPACQAMDLPPTEANTWQITWTWGETVPELGKRAVGELACELLKLCNDEPCELPSGVTTIVRQGVTLELLQPTDFLENGRMGLRQCDLFLGTSNPGSLQSPPQVYSIDRPRARQPGA